MSSITLNVADIFPAGTSVAAYPRSNWYGDTRPSGTPQGSSAATATVAADGTLTFASLTDGVPYFAYAQVSGVDKYRRFMPSSPPGSAGSSDAVLRKAVQSQLPLWVKSRGQKIIPNTWTNTAQKSYPENCVWDPDTNQYVMVYMAEQQTPSSFVYVCYATAPTIAAIKAGQFTDGGIVTGMSAGGQTPHLIREGTAWYIFAANTGVSNIDIWRSTTGSPAGGGTFSKVQTSILTLGTIVQASTPAAPTVTPTTGAPGTLAAVSHSYKVTALTAAGETTASTATAATLSATGYETISWTAATGETNGYNIYKQILPGNLYLLIGTVAHGTTTYQDNTGTPLSQQQPPLSNVSASFDKTFALEQYVIRIPQRDPLYAQGYRYAMYYMGQSTSSSPEQVGIVVSPTLNAAAASWVKLNNGNPLIGTAGGYGSGVANDSEGSADPFVWIAPNGKIVVFYVAIEAGGVGKTMRWHYAAATADQISGPYTKLGTVVETPSWPDVGKNGTASWAGATYPIESHMNGDEGGVWRGSLIRNDIDGEVLWIHAGKNLSGAGVTNTTVMGFVDVWDMASPLLRGVSAVNPWERVEIEATSDPRWVRSGTWTLQNSTEWTFGSMYFSSTVNDTATLYFEGVGARIGLGSENNMGIVEIYVDGVYDRTLDLYSPNAVNHSPVVYEKLGLTPGYHSIQVKVVGKNAASSNTVVVVDYGEILPSGVGL